MKIKIKNSFLLMSIQRISFYTPWLSRVKLNHTEKVRLYMSDYQKRKGAKVIGTFIDALSWNESIERIIEWGKQRQSKCVCLCNVHSSVTATNDENLATALSHSDMVLPDGAPVAWVLRRKGYRDQTRIAGPDLMERLCKALKNTDTGVYLFGASEETLVKLKDALTQKHPGLKILGALSPKYGDWSKAEEKKYIEKINQSGAGIIFVGLGCPKQEIWMANNRENIQGVMLGVGAAFDFHAGMIKRAPMIIQKAGFEWLHRLLSEPGRLWKRYLVTNSIFLYRATIDLSKK